ncbi:MAG: redox-sensing transcriptional repressor Rex [Armatimonadetes bacterium]|nr:redox-sensing transcriptional repressor Rex [Armatimonadota bacterium]
MPNELSRRPNVPEGTVTRLCDYLRVVTMMERRGQPKASSVEIGQWAGVKASQVRKDLSYFGEFGRRGLGYETAKLRMHIQDILGVRRQRPTVVIGAGNLGSALARYPGFAAHGFQIVGIYDNYPARIGHRLGNMKIRSTRDLPEDVKTLKVEIAILTVPEHAAQETADFVISTGIKAIVNFAPLLLNVPKDVNLRNVDLARELETLCFYLPTEVPPTERED